MRHVRNLIAFVRSGSDPVNGHIVSNMETVADTFEAMWKKKVIQFQIPLFTESTRSDWLLLFDDVLADAQELGPLRSFRAEVSEQDAAYIQSLLPGNTNLSEAIEVIAYYNINRMDGTDWALYPSTAFEAYFGNTNLTHKYQKEFFQKFGQKADEHCGVSRYCIFENIAKRVKIIEN